MNIVREWYERYRETRLERAGRRELDALSDHLRRDVGLLHGEPATGAGRRRDAATVSTARSAVVLHLPMGGPDTPQATRSLRPERQGCRIDTRAA